MRGKGKVELKAPVYALQEPVTGAYIALRGAQPKLEHLATIAPATAECLVCLQGLATMKLAGTPHEIVRVDRL